MRTEKGSIIPSQKRIAPQKRFERWATHEFLRIYNGLIDGDFQAKVSESPDIIAYSKKAPKKRLGIEVTELHNINQHELVFAKTDSGIQGTEALFATLKHVFDKKTKNDYREGYPVILLLVNQFYLCQPHYINRIFLRKYHFPKHHFSEIFLLTPRITRKKVDHNIYQLFRLKRKSFVKVGQLQKKKAKRR